MAWAPGKEEEKGAGALTLGRETGIDDDNASFESSTRTPSRERKKEQDVYLAIDQDTPTHEQAEQAVRECGRGGHHLEPSTNHRRCEASR
jgi:hypothetical protein